jgi:flavodoxin
MKKIFAAVIVCSLMLGITACGSTKEETLEVTTQPETEEALEATTQSETDGALEVTTQPETGETQSMGQTTELSTENISQESETNTSTSGILIAYFSRADNIEFDSEVDAITSASINLDGDNFTGNAALLAHMAQTVTGGDVFSIETVNKYPTGYRDTTDQAKIEQNNNVRPALSTHIDNIDDYDTVILIYPNWWGGLPMPVFTFLEEYDFTGKTIMPLCTHEGSGLGMTLSEIAKTCPGAIVSEGLAVRGGNAASAQVDVEKWLKK